jgi:hypothetical protein
MDCPFCLKINDDFVVDCDSCHKPLQGEGYLRALVKKYKDVLGFRKSHRFRDLLLLEARSEKAEAENESFLEELTKKVERSWLKEIKEALLRSGVIKAHDATLRKELQKIRDSNFTSDPSWKEYIYKDADEEGIVLDLDPIEIKEREREIGTVIVQFSLPAIFDTCLDEIKSCYQYGLINSTVVFCRVLLEISLEEALIKRGLRKNKEEVLYIDRDYKLSRSITEFKNLKKTYQRDFLKNAIEYAIEQMKFYTLVIKPINVQNMKPFAL